MRKLFYRLLEGPFWVGDWRSTGIKSYATVNSAIQYLYSVNLVTRERGGHRILYQMKPPEPQPEGSSWLPKSVIEQFWPKYSPTEWLPYLTTKKEKAAFVRDQSKTPKWAIEMHNGLKESTKMVGVYGRLSGEDKHELEIELTNREIMELIQEVKPGLSVLQYVIGWERITSLRACLNCLENHKLWVETTIDNETKEILCPNCGLVLSRDPFQREPDTRPSPFAPPQN
jgi:DNA-directed RNA polymerase subunit RPC12/RpoP